MSFPEATFSGRSARSNDQTTKDHGTSGGGQFGDDSQLRQRRSKDVRMEDGTHTSAPNDATLHARCPNPARRTTSFTTTASMESLPQRGSIRSNTLSRSSSRPILSGAIPGVNMDKHEPDLWHSAPLLFAVLPAIGGLAFKRGSVIVTDLALLVLAGVYLNWCLVTPWRWYNQARRIQLASEPLTGFASEEALVEETNEDRQNTGGIEAQADGNAQAPHGTVDNTGSASPRRDSVISKQNISTDEEHPAEEAAPNAGSFPAATIDATNAGADPVAAADTELARHETLALAFTVIGPLLGAIILHHVRTALTTSSFHADELISGMHLTLFVLGAELRPIRHCMTLVHNRTLHLQRVVREDPHALASKTDASAAAKTAEHLTDLTTRLDELERSAADAKATATPPTPTRQGQSNVNSAPPATQDSLRKFTTQLQTQIDALNRAVRRYEKRTTAQTLQTDSRLRDLEARMQDALTLAAVAARDTQKPGLIRSMAGWMGTAVTVPLRMVRAAVALPMRLVEWGLMELFGAVGGYRKSRHGTRRVRAGLGDGRTAGGKPTGKLPARESDRFGNGTGSGIGSYGVRRLR